jgi:hypothetical protein
MSWKRLYFVVEGQTEERFVKIILRSHLEQYEIEAIPVIVKTNRKLAKKGGVINFAHIKNELQLLPWDETYVTTMIDFYKLPSEFPGWSEVRYQKTSSCKIAVLETAFKNSISKLNFIPYIQQHEFEALLYCDLSQLAYLLFGFENALEELKQEVAHLAPEDINEGTETAPSKRIIRHVPPYKNCKVVEGVDAVAAIGLEKLRAQCPHFNQWLTQLEQLSDCKK